MLSPPGRGGGGGRHVYSNAREIDSFISGVCFLFHTDTCVDLPLTSLTAAGALRLKGSQTMRPAETVACGEVAVVT